MSHRDRSGNVHCSGGKPRTSCQASKILNIPTELPRLCHTSTAGKDTGLNGYSNTPEIFTTTVREFRLRLKRGKYCG
jgi:hypothetical protein